jgi:hypothetical protein
MPCTKQNTYATRRQAVIAAVMIFRKRGYLFRSYHRCVEHHGLHLSRKRARGKSRFSVALPPLAST